MIVRRSNLSSLTLSTKQIGGGFFIPLALLLVSSFSIDTVNGSIFTFDSLIQPSQQNVQYTDGYLRGPGSIDLSGLNFTAVSEAYSSDVISGSGDDMTLSGDDDSGGRHNRLLEGGVEHGATYVDIVIFKLPRKCAHSKDGCDWSELGIGKRITNKDGTLGEQRWCCSTESAALGLCKATSESQFGRLLVDEDKFSGERRFLSVPAIGAMSKHIRFGAVDNLDSGTYVVLYANCNEKGRNVSMQGTVTWLSNHGYLPGELFGFMYFYTFVTVVYLALFLWFVFLMVQYKDTRIPIEKYIIFAIGLGLCEMSFRSGDYYVWNDTGYRSSFVIWVGILVGVVKQGMSRTVAVMVSMGWGVCRDKLSHSAMFLSIGLALIYIFLSGLTDCLIVFAAENISTLSLNTGKTIIGFVEILGFLSSVVETIFTVWILIALSRTIEYLQANNEKTKLERMSNLWYIFIGACVLVVGLVLFSVADRAQEEGIVGEEHAWLKDAASEVIYLYLLIGIAILWRPNENAQSYAYFKELTSYYDEDDDNNMMDYPPKATDDDEEDFELAEMNG